jgi:hypothetical protein
MILSVDNIFTEVTQVMQDFANPTRGGNGKMTTRQYAEFFWRKPGAIGGGCSSVGGKEWICWSVCTVYELHLEKE